MTAVPDPSGLTRPADQHHAMIEGQRSPAGRAPADRSIPGRALAAGFTQLVRRGLRGVWVRGELPSSAVVWAANHHSWWDGFVAAAVLQEQHRPAALLMDGANLSAFGFMRSAGVISAQRPRQALQVLREGRVLVIFPEGELRSPGPLRTMARGAAWLGSHAPAAVVPVAVRVVSRGQQYAEALVDIAPEVAPDELFAALKSQLEELDAAIADCDPRAAVPGFRCAVKGRASWDERLSRWAGAIRR
ncbi:MAG: 1-acyl-sn-glycerol-3-phosphate acyltransferase [Actinomycetota bacterium]|nr:1-acyl-sn-glycerol-3-phosphate acyltransferase [Actinomycetota bacterium]